MGEIQVIFHKSIDLLISSMLINNSNRNEEFIMLDMHVSVGYHVFFGNLQNKSNKIRTDNVTE